jgi:hypothetical protein
MTARVRGDSAAEMVSAERPWVSGSTSAKTGTAPTSGTLLADAMKLRGVTITSSPGPTPRPATRVQWRGCHCKRDGMINPDPVRILAFEMAAFLTGPVIDPV